MEAAKIMKQILVLSNLSFWPCIACATICAGPFKEVGDYEIFVSFAPEDKFVEMIDEVCDDYNIIIGIGYNKSIAANRFYVLRGKFMLLSPSKNDEKFIPNFFGNKISLEKQMIMSWILETANGLTNRVFSNLEKENGLAEFTKRAQPDINEGLAYAELRYKFASRVIKNIYGLKENLEMHKYFLREIIDQIPAPYIESFLGEYDLMELETERLIKNIRPLLSSNADSNSNIGFVKSDNDRFFKDDVLDALKKSGYFSMVLEFRSLQGQYITMYLEKYIRQGRILSGGIKENWSEIIYKLN